MVLAYFFLPSFLSQEKPDYSNFASYLTELNQKHEITKNKFELTQFNPNTVSLTELIQMGLSNKTANTWISYREKISLFEHKSDINKVYGLTNDDYRRLAPYIEIEPHEELSEIIDSKKTSTASLRLTPFMFDPNKASESILENLGLSQKQIQNIIKFRQKGGHFYSKEDVKKIYTISLDEFSQLEPFIIIPIEENKEEIQVSKNDDFVIDINKSEGYEFEKIHGIGEKLGKRIVKYRKMLGGFYAISQLAEVYGIDENLITENKKHFQVSTKSIQKININKVEIKELSKHLYISFNDARKIVNFRKVHGLFTSVDEIKTNNLVTEEVYSKIAYYLITK